MLGPPRHITGSHFCLSDCSACLSYAREDRLTDLSDRKYSRKSEDTLKIYSRKGFFPALPFPHVTLPCAVYAVMHLSCLHSLFLYKSNMEEEARERTSAVVFSHRSE